MSSNDTAQCQHWFSVTHIAKTLLQHLSPRHTKKQTNNLNIQNPISTKPPLRNARVLCAFMSRLHLTRGGGPERRGVCRRGPEMLVFVYIYIYIYIYTYIYVYIHMYICIYIYIYVSLELCMGGRCQ